MNAIYLSYKLLQTVFYRFRIFYFRLNYHWAFLCTLSGTTVLILEQFFNFWLLKVVMYSIAIQYYQLDVDKGDDYHQRRINHRLYKSNHRISIFRNWMPVQRMWVYFFIVNVICRNDQRWNEIKYFFSVVLFPDTPFDAA